VQHCLVGSEMCIRDSEYCLPEAYFDYLAIAIWLLFI
jgi:hypothetical protein